MKKFGILFAITMAFTLSLTASTTKADNPPQSAQESITTLPDSAELTFKTVYSDVKAGLSALGESLKVGADHVYTVLVKQQLVNSVFLLIEFLFGIILIFMSIKIFNKLTSEQWECPTPYNLTCIISGITGLIIFIIPLIKLDVIITGFINPEYGAINEISKMIH